MEDSPTIPLNHYPIFRPEPFERLINAKGSVLLRLLSSCWATGSASVSLRVEIGMTARSNSIQYTWGTTTAERDLPFPCDRLLPDADEAYFRAVDVNAPPSRLFRWLSQLRVAPYSYDWIDNRGRQSPRTLTPGLDELLIGQRVMGIFRLVEFEPNRHLTIVLDSDKAARLFGDLAGSYAIFPSGGG